MLDAFLEVAMERTKEASANEDLIENLTKLPNQMLIDIANGTDKLASMCGASNSWVDKFAGTPLVGKAIALEQAYIEQEAASDAGRNANRDGEDKIRLERRMLDLELAKLEIGTPEQGAAEPSVAKLARNMASSLAMRKESMSKESIGIVNAFRGLKNTAQRGYKSGKWTGAGGAAPGTTASGAHGAVSAGKNYMTGLAKKNPGTALGMGAVAGGAVAAPLAMGAGEVAAPNRRPRY